MKRVVRMAVSGSAVLAVSVALPACGSSSSGSSGGGSAKTLTIGFTVKNFQVPFWLTMRDAAQKEAKAKGVNLIFVAGRTVGDNTTQVNQIENFITRQVDAIAVAPNESAGIVPAIKKATAAGIPVLAVDTATDPPNAVKSFIATDSFKAGVLQGQWAKKALKGKKPVIAAMHGQIGSQVDTDRWNGFLKGIGPNAKQYVVADQAPGGIAGPTQTSTENVLTAHPDVNVIWNIDDDGSVGAGKAVKSAGKTGQVLITGMDGGCPQVKAMKTGAFQADVLQFPAQIGKIAIDMAIKAANKQAIPAHVDSGEMLVTDNPQQGVPSKPVSWGLSHCFG